MAIDPDDDKIQYKEELPSDCTKLDKLSLSELELSDNNEVQYLGTKDGNELFNRDEIESDFIGKPFISKEEDEDYIKDLKDSHSERSIKICDDEHDDDIPEDEKFIFAKKGTPLEMRIGGGDVLIWDDIGDEEDDYYDYTKTKEWLEDEGAQVDFQDDYDSGESLNKYKLIFIRRIKIDDLPEWWEEIINDVWVGRLVFLSTDIFSCSDINDILETLDLDTHYDTSFVNGGGNLTGDCESIVESSEFFIPNRRGTISTSCSNTPFTFVADPIEHDSNENTNILEDTVKFYTKFEGNDEPAAPLITEFSIIKEDEFPLTPSVVPIVDSTSEFIPGTVCHFHVTISNVTPPIPTLVNHASRELYFKTINDVEYKIEIVVTRFTFVMQCSDDLRSFTRLMAGGDCDFENPDDAFLVDLTPIVYPDPGPDAYMSTHEKFTQNLYTKGLLNEPS